MTNNTPQKPDWSAAYPISHEAYQQQARDAVDAQMAYLKAQQQPGYIPPGSLGAFAIDAAMRGLKITDPQKYQRIKAAQVNHEDVGAILRGEA